MKKNKLNVLTCGYFGGRRNITHNIKQFFKNIKYAYQRITKGYCDRDCWNLDHFYTELIIETLENYKKNLHGAPQPYFNESGNPKTREQIKPWEEKINQVQVLFKKCKDGLDGPDYSYDELERKYKKALTALSEIIVMLWD